MLTDRMTHVNGAYAYQIGPAHYMTFFNLRIISGVENGYAFVFMQGDLGRWLKISRGGLV